MSYSADHPWKRNLVWLAEAGIKVVQDRCLMVDHRRLMHASAEHDA